MIGAYLRSPGSVSDSDWRDDEPEADELDEFDELDIDESPDVGEYRWRLIAAFGPQFLETL